MITWANTNAQKASILDIRDPNVVVVRHKQTDLRITKLCKQEKENRDFEVTYHIMHADGGQDFGHRFFSWSNLRRAFFGVGTSDHEDGLFIRQLEWLNIPCAGTGKDGDPNFTIFITPQLKEEIGKLLQ